MHMFIVHGRVGGVVVKCTIEARGPDEARVAFKKKHDSMGVVVVDKVKLDRSGTTSTGRIASEPVIQNIPIRTADGAALREAFANSGFRVK